MRASVLEQNSGDYLRFWAARNDANPDWRLGAADAEEFHIQAIYTSGAQTLARVDFKNDSSLACITRFQIGTAAGDDWTVYDGTNNLVLVEGDTTRITFRLDGGANSDFIVTNAATEILNISSDNTVVITPTTAMSVVLGTTAGDDFTVNDGTDDLIQASGDLGEVRINLATSAGNDFVVHDGTNSIVLFEADTTRFTFLCDAGANSDFAVNDGTDDLILIQSDLKSVIFDLAGGAGGDFSVTDGSSDMILIQTDDDTVDIVGHDASAAGLMLGGVLVTATAAEINAVADVSTRIVTLVATGAITAATHADHILLMGEVGGDAEAVFTLPAATGTGDVYKFIVSVVNTSNYKIQVVTNDTMDGNILTNSTGDTPDLAQFWPTASDSDTITLDGTTTGGVSIGDWIELIDIATDQWAVYGVTTSSGTEATPFSAAIS